MVEKTGLKNIAVKLDSPQAATPAARRQARVRARRRNGVHIYRIEVSDRAAEGLILRFILDGQLTETQAVDTTTSSPRCRPCGKKRASDFGELINRRRWSMST
jgi:hypothetical protein